MSGGRRIRALLPRVTGRPPHKAAREIEDTLRDFTRAGDDGAPPGYSDVDPQDVVVAGTPSPGSSDDGWSSASHVHNVPVSGPLALGGASSTGSSGTVSDGGHIHDITGRPTAKGSLWGHNGSAPVEVPVGTNYKLLEADSAQAPGIGWSTLATILGRLLTAEGDFIVRDGSGAAVRNIAETYHGHVIWVDNAKAGNWGLDKGHPWRGNWVLDTMTDATPAEMFRIKTTAPGDDAMVRVSYGIEVYKGNDQQVEKGSFEFSLMQDPLGVMRSHLGTVTVGSHIETAGAITSTFSLATSGSDILLKVAIASTLATPYDYAAIHFDFHVDAFNLDVALHADVYGR